jgi:hypothetical protein
MFQGKIFFFFFFIINYMFKGRIETNENRRRAGELVTLLDEPYLAFLFNHLPSPPSAPAVGAFFFKLFQRPRRSKLSMYDDRRGKRGGIQEKRPTEFGPNSFCGYLTSRIVDPTNQDFSWGSG